MNSNSNKKECPGIESLILDLMVKYGALPINAVINYVKNIKLYCSEPTDDPELAAELEEQCFKEAKAEVSSQIKALKRNLRISTSPDEKTIKNSDKIEINRNLINSFWILSEFAKESGPLNQFRAQYPSDILFIKDGKQFEIMSPTLGSEFQINVIKNKNQAIKKEEDKVNLILCLANKEQLSRCLPYTEDLNVLYSQVIPTKDGNPEIKFYTV